ncbi:MAG: glycosyltransferase, partial [Dehalococcoidia bacterium]|nr:glycosyltransferase [Dehalococcoidia bacterium]
MGYFSLPILVSSQFWPCIKLALAINSPNQKILRILFVSAADWAFQIHRLSLAKWLVQQGHKVAVICPPGEVTSELEQAGLKIFSMPLSRERLSATEILASSKGIRKAVEEFEADILHCVSLRCILLGWLATRSQTNPPRVVNHVIGMGSIFSKEPTSLKMHGFRK